MSIRVLTRMTGRARSPSATASRGWPRRRGRADRWLCRVSAAGGCRAESPRGANRQAGETSVSAVTLMRQGATAEERSMSRILAGIAAFALLSVLALSPAGAAERRSDGLKIKSAAASTDMSAQRYWRARRAYWGGWGVRRAWGPGYGFYGPWYRPLYRPYYAGGYGYGYASPYAYGAYPYQYGGYPIYARPVVSVGFGFGPRWGGWGGWGW